MNESRFIVNGWEAVQQRNVRIVCEDSLGPRLTSFTEE